MSVTSNNQKQRNEKQESLKSPNASNNELNTTKNPLTSTLHTTSQTYKITPNFYKNLPNTPGVYMYLANNKILYVGKAKDLRARISSYFVPQLLLPKTQQMLKKATHIKIIETLSETEAFLLEATLIKLFKPPYNIQLKDDKTYPYLAISKIYLDPKLKKEYYYKVFITRTLNKKDTIYFGPYPDVAQLRKVLKALRRIFPFPSCSKTKFLEHRKKGRPCLYGQIGLCPAPCVSKKNATENAPSKQMTLNIRRIKQFLALGQTAYIKKLENKMKQYAKQEQFEKAKQLRDLILKINQLNTITIEPVSYISNPNIKQELQEQIIQEIKQYFGPWFKQTREPKTQKHVFRIETYDISTLFGTNSTASMVVSLNGKVEKSEFKRFKIKFVEKTSDFDMLKETFLRRLKHSSWGAPNILLIDGGKAQVSSVLKALIFLTLSEPIRRKTKQYDQHKNLLTAEDILNLRELELQDMWEKFISTTNFTGTSEIATNTKTKTSEQLPPSLFAKFILQNVPIWGIFKPFDYFVAYMPQLKLVLQDQFNAYLQFIGESKNVSIQTTANWLVLMPRKKLLGIQHLRNLRDHAHNFAKEYHKKLRDSIREEQ